MEVRREELSGDSGLNTLVTGVVFEVESFTWKYEEKSFQRQWS